MPPPPSSLSIAENEVGPAVIGAFISMGFWGPLALQSLTYFRSSQSDPITWRKYMVGTVVGCTTFVVAMECNLAYATVIYSSDVDFLFSLTWRNYAYLVPSIPVAFCVQVFYGWQIRGLTRKLAPAILVWTLAVIASGAQIATITWGGILGDTRLWSPITPVVYVWLVGTALNDILIATILTTYLRHQRTGFQTTDDLINRIARFAVQTSALTALCATLDIILFASIKNNDHYIFNFPLYPLYANCLLASLNARNEWFDRKGTGQSDPKDTKIANNERRRKQKTDGGSGSLRIHATQETVIDIDGEESGVDSEVYRLRTLRRAGNADGPFGIPQNAETDSNALSGRRHYEHSHGESALEHTPSEHSVDTKGFSLS